MDWESRKAGKIGELKNDKIHPKKYEKNTKIQNSKMHKVQKNRMQKNTDENCKTESLEKGEKLGLWELVGSGRAGPASHNAHNL